MLILYLISVINYKILNMYNSNMKKTNFILSEYYYYLLINRLRHGISGRELLGMRNHAMIPG